MRLMKLSGICGLVLFAVSLISLIIMLVKFLGNPYNLVNSGATGAFSGMGIIQIIIIVIILVLSFVFLYGFIKLGNKTQSKYLKATAISTFILSIILVIIFLVSIITAASQLQSQDYATAQQASSSNNAMGVLTLVVTILTLISLALFFTALISIGGKTRFARVSGILGLVVIVLGIIAVTMAYSSLKNLASDLYNNPPQEITDLSEKYSSIDFSNMTQEQSLELQKNMMADIQPVMTKLVYKYFMPAFIVGLIMIIITYAAVLMHSLCLLYASKNFE